MLGLTPQQKPRLAGEGDKSEGDKEKNCPQESGSLCYLEFFWFGKSLTCTRHLFNTQESQYILNLLKLLK